MLWKTADVIMLPKPGKTVNTPKSYRRISFLPVLKLFEKLFYRRRKTIIDEGQTVPDYQFDIRNKLLVDQVHRITEVIEESLEKKKICSVVFLDVAQEFDKVWHDGRFKKLKYSEFLPIKIHSGTFGMSPFRTNAETQVSNI